MMMTMMTQGISSHLWWTSVTTISEISPSMREMCSTWRTKPRLSLTWTGSQGLSPLPSLFIFHNHHIWINIQGRVVQMRRLHPKHGQCWQELCSEGEDQNQYYILVFCKYFNSRPGRTATIVKSSIVCPTWPYLAFIPSRWKMKMNTTFTLRRI